MLLFTLSLPPAGEVVDCVRFVVKLYLGNSLVLSCTQMPKVGDDRLEPGNPASTLAMMHQVIPALLPRTYAEQAPDHIPTRLIPHMLIPRTILSCSLSCGCDVPLIGHMQIRRTADYDQLSVLAGNPDPDDALWSAI